MKRFRYVTLMIIIFTMLAFELPIHATTVTIIDQYWGARPTHQWADRDVIGLPGFFGISRMRITYEGGRLKYVDIFSRYFNNMGLFGTEMGDLFISIDGWHPNTSGPHGNRYAQDNHATGESWEYALVLDKHKGATSGQFGLYQVQEDNIIMSHAPHNYVYREGQEVQYNGTGSTITGNWSINWGNFYGDFDDYLRFDLSSMGFDFGAVDFGFHWTMTCGNDVIEGGATVVPEPGTLALLGSGIISLGITNRFRRKKKKK